MPTVFEQIKALHRETTAGAKEGLAFKYFSRPLASTILYFIRDTGITPNQVTILSLIVGIAGSAVHLSVLSWAGLLLGGALFMLAHVLDALDGQLARLKKAGSALGMHFDFFIDEIKAYLMYVALGLRLWWQTADSGAGLAPAGGPLRSPTWLLDPLTESLSPVWILYWLMLGLLALAIGLSCTQFFKRPEWRSRFPPREKGFRPATLRGRAVAAAERIGHFIVDYPSYIIPLCLLNRVDAYFLLYTLVVAAYASRALLSMAIALWRIDPYGPEAP